MKEEIYKRHWKDKTYPENLLALPENERPELLYISGRIKKSDKKAVCIVGSRKTTTYGRRMAEKFARELAENNITIVSGLARGIDTVAHMGALRVGGRTIAVMGCGLDIIYPPENELLAKKIRGNGALV